MNNCLSKFIKFNNLYLNHCFISTSVSCNKKFGTIWLGSKLRVVDNSEIGREAALMGKAPYVIRVYNKQNRGCLGDRVLVAIRGQKRRGYLVGLRQHEPGVPRFDSNNLVLVGDDGSPIGTRILAPIPSILRGYRGNINKIMAIATKFV